MLQLNPIFTSHGVFAAHKPIRIYGEGRGTAEILFAGQTRTVTADGAWEIEFPPMEYGGPYDLVLRQEEETLRLEDLYVGRVYLMAGQSNVQFKLRASSYPADESRGNPMVRLFTAPRLEAGEPYTPDDGWVICTEENARSWSALAYHVGQIQGEDGVAVGLIACYQGASVIESWIPEGALEPLGITLSPEDKGGAHTYPPYQAWNRDGVLYREALSAILPYPLSAAVWYQGESDTVLKESLEYKTELKALIRIWRDSFRDEALPFVVVQIADYISRAGEAWSNVQKAQWEIQFEVPAVKTVVSADVCENDDIHPPTKIHLAHRIVGALRELDPENP